MRGADMVFSLAPVLCLSENLPSPGLCKKVSNAKGRSYSYQRLYDCRHATRGKYLPKMRNCLALTSTMSLVVRDPTFRHPALRKDPKAQTPPRWLAAVIRFLPILKLLKELVSGVRIASTNRHLVPGSCGGQFVQSL